ncbi:CpxP family protein [Vibrio hepatarius]|uniref:CpxP family protein n=1 Tax=Vibrio hepatarius TaxID=171383 RepID=UPI001C091E78|nr:CpxP family protein [Vibrio hepatarius]MBU2896973.1 CpxP family protein [Vibrio hepatarius]
MKTAKKLILAMVIFPLTLGSVSVFANNGKEHGKKGHKEFTLDRGLMRELDLTQEQQAQLKDLREAMKKDFKAQYQENFAVHQEERQAHKEKMQALLLADSFDKEAAHELAKVMLEKQTEHNVKLLEKQHQLLSVLTPEQKTKYIEVQKERDEKRAQKRQERLTKS